MKLFLSFLSVILLSAGITAFTPPADGGFKVGDTATDFKLKNVDGKMVSLSDYKDAKGYIIIFTCNHCPFSVAYEDRIIALNNKYAGQGYPVIAINPNDPAVSEGDSYELMQARAKEKSFNFPYLYDDGQKVFPVYGATRTPHVFVLDKNRVVKYIGAIDDNVNEPKSVQVKYLENAIDALKSGKEITTTYTKAVGCSIKVKK
jgi:peroxiredoxin